MDSREHKKECIMKKPRRLRTGENPFVWLMLLFSLVTLFLAYRISGLQLCAPGTFPLAAAAVMVVTMVLVLLENRKLRKPSGTKGLIDELRRAVNRLLPRQIVLYIVIILAYMLAIKPLHFFPSSFIFLLVSTIYLRGTTWKKAIFITSGALVAVYLIFQFVFQVTLP